MKYLYLLLFLAIFTPAFSQDDPLYAQYLNNPLTINPAYTGLNNELNASVSYRRQWSNFDGSPTTFNASAHSSVSRNRMGIGMLLVQDKSGTNKNTEAYATYAYRLNLNGSYLSFGIQAGFINFKTNNDALNVYDPSDPAFSNNLNVIKPSFGAGAILSSEHFFAGLSVPRMLRSTTISSDNTGSVKTSLYNQHYYGALAYIFYLSPRVRLRPSCLVKYVSGAPLSIDYMMAINLDQKYSAGLFTRNANAFGFLLQCRLAGAYRFGYVFEVPAGNSVGTRFNTHEITLGVNLAVFSFQHATLSNF